MDHVADSCWPPFITLLLTLAPSLSAGVQNHPLLWRWCFSSRFKMKLKGLWSVRDGNSLENCEDEALKSTHWEIISLPVWECDEQIREPKIGHVLHLIAWYWAKQHTSDDHQSPLIMQAESNLGVREKGEVFKLLQFWRFQQVWWRSLSSVIQDLSLTLKHKNWGMTVGEHNCLNWMA